MPIDVIGGFGSGSGGGLALRRPVDVFTGASTSVAEAARDTYFQTTNAAALDEFINNASLAIIIRVTGSADAFQTFIGADGDTYDADNWVDRTDAVRGPTGETGAAGSDGSDGADGADGSNGRRGQRGLTGADGSDGSDGAAGTGIYASFSADGSTSWHETPASSDEYIRFATGTTRPAENAGSWSTAIKFVGEDGAGNGMGGGSGADGDDGTSVFVGFSVTGTSAWTATASATHRFIRFASGENRPSEDSSDWGAAIRFVGADGAAGSDGQRGADGNDGTDGDDGEDGLSVFIGYSANNSDWHENVATSDTHIRFARGSTRPGAGSAAWSTGKRFVGRDGAAGADGNDGEPGADGNDGAPGAPGADGNDGNDGAPGAPGADGNDGAPGVRGSRWFVTTQATPQTQTGEAQGDYQIVADGSVFLRGVSSWTDTGLDLAGSGGGSDNRNAGQIDADIDDDDDPPSGGTIKAWLTWLAGQNAIGEVARTQLGTRLDSLEHSAVRAAVDDWQDVTDHLAAYGNAGLLIATSAWTTIDAASMIWQNSPSVQTAGVYYAIAQIPDEFDIDRFRVQWDITGNGVYNFATPNVQNTWTEFTGTLENGAPDTKYYVLVDRATGNTQYRATVPVGGSLNLQHNNGTPASVALPDDSITPAMLDADDSTKQAAFRTRLGITGTGGGTSGGGGDVQLTLIGSRFTQVASGDTQWYATGISPGTIMDDDLLYIRAMLLESRPFYRPMRGSTFNGLPENTAGAALSTSQSGLWTAAEPVNFSNLYASKTSGGELLIASDSDWEADDWIELYKLEGGGSGGLASVEPSDLDGITTPTAGRLIAVGTDTSEFTEVDPSTLGGSVTDDSIEPSHLNADTSQQKAAFRTRLGISTTGTTTTVGVIFGESAFAAGGTITSQETINVPLGDTFVWRAPRIERMAYRAMRMPVAARELVSIIGESGEIIEAWDKQSDNVTWTTGPVANNARDPETFTIRIT